MQSSRIMTPVNMGIRRLVASLYYNRLTPFRHQCDDGFLEEPNMVLDDLHLDLLEKHHQDNMQFMASMLARRHLDEEGGTTDTATTENSQKHEKDSGVGRTDESTRNDESSEQDTFDNESIIAPPCTSNKYRHASVPETHYMSTDVTCPQFRDMSEYRCISAGNSPRRGDGSRKDSESSLERELSILNREMEEIQVECQDLVENHMKEQTRLAGGYNESVLRGDTQRSPRIVPRMGTRQNFKPPGESWSPKDGTLSRNSGSLGSNSPCQTGPPSPAPNGGVNINNNMMNVPPGYSTAMSYSSISSGKNKLNSPVAPGPCMSAATTTGSVYSCVSSTISSSCRGGQGMPSSGFNSHTNTNTNSSSNTSSGVCEREKEAWTTTSAYNTGESCRSTPLMTLELNPEPEYAEVGLSGSMLCLAATPSSSGTAIVTSDTEKQTQTPTKPREYSSEDSGHGKHKKGSNSSPSVKTMNIPDNLKAGLKHPAKFGESLQDLYLRCSDVMYTNRANLEHTMAVQQKLFQQQLEQQSKQRGHAQSPGQSTGSGNDITVGEIGAKNSPGNTDSGQMEWVVKRRPDGTRYITRRQVKSKMLKERAKKISEERCGMTTDDDAMSEMKHGRYWSKEDRKRHFEKAKDYKKKKEILCKAKMDTLKEIEEKKEVNIVEMSHRKMMKHKGKKVFDNFTTVKEMLAHGNKQSDGKTYNPLLSVTTV